MGSDLPGKQELETEILRLADTVVCDTRAQCNIGCEIQHLATAGIEREVLELGDFTSGAICSENAGTAITVCDLTGTGAQDTAIAVEAFARVEAFALGTVA